MNISKITIGRLYNLGNYEHIRYELTIEIKDGGSASDALIATEKLLAGLSPIRNACIKSERELQTMANQLEAMKTMPAVEWDRHYRGYSGTPSEIIERHQQSLNEETKKAKAAFERAVMARKLFDNLGGAVEWKDAKLDWQDYDDWNDNQ